MLRALCKAGAGMVGRSTARRIKTHCRACHEPRCEVQRACSKNTSLCEVFQEPDTDDTLVVRVSTHEWRAGTPYDAPLAKQGPRRHPLIAMPAGPAAIQAEGQP